MDFFITKRFFWYASSYFEKDTFQDLKLRTALSSGPGYNFIEKGDYASPWLKDLSLYAEAGLAYFNEDLRMLMIKRPSAPDGQSGSTGRSWMSA